MRRCFPLVAVRALALAGLFFSLTAPLAAQCDTGDNDLGGSVFREINANGVVDGVDFLLDGSVAPITVNAYDQTTGTLLATTSLLANGTYEFPGLFSSAADVRIEFVNLPSYLQTSYATTNQNVTSVQYYAAPSCSANLLVQNPGDFCGSATPDVVTSCYIEGDPNADAARAAADVLISFPFTANGTFTPTPGHEGRTEQIGSTYGLAYQSASGSLFASAFQKRLAAYGQVDAAGAISGDNGTGAIYIATDATDDSDADIRLFADLNAVYGSNVFGANPHQLGTAQWPNEPGDGIGSSYDAVGKVSFGDIDIAEDQRSLWAVNLADRQLYNIPLGGLTTPVAPASPAGINRFPLFDLVDCDGDGSLDTSSDVDIRPFALKVKDGLVYVGMVCSGESTTSIADLSGHVFSFDPQTSSFTSRLSFPLNYDRGCGLADISGGNAGCLLEGEWNPWRPTFEIEPAGHVQSTQAPDPPTPAAGFTEYAYPQPMLTDIEFDAQGNLMVGMRDRFGDQMGNGSPDPDGGAAESADGYGDLLIARPSGSSWTISFAENDHPNEFFEDDWNDGSFGHQETGVGGLLVLPGVDEILATVFDPTNGFFGGNSLDFSAGTQAWSVLTGAVAREWVVYDANANVGPQDPFGKANGLGDLEAICLPAPLELGNFVWFDADGDGIQDADEAPLPNVTIELWFDSDGNGSVDTQVGTATTGPNGEYIFGGPGDVNMAGTNSVVPGGVYEIRLDLGDADLPTGAQMTVQNGVSGLGDGEDDLRDSDGDNGTLTPGYSTIQLTAGAPGENDHTNDFGLNTPVSIGSTVFYDTNDNGVQDGGETGIPGVLVQVIDPGPDGIFGNLDDFVAGFDTTDGSGNYFVGDLPPGDYQVVVAPPANAPNSSTFTDPADNNVDGNDNGDQPGGSGTAATSPIISLTSDGEPDDTTETFQGNGQDSADDNNGDMTVDFGFVPDFDLALQKTNASPAQIVPGDPVTFTITVTNQSSLPVQNVVVADTIPTGFSLSAASAGTWSGGAGATGSTSTTLAGPIASGGTAVTTITLVADSPFGPGGGTFNNYAEVIQFEDTFNGTVQPDVDSDADLGAGNDPNEVNDDISNASADHDDLDPEPVTVNVFDVALQKTNATPSQVMPGGTVTFDITVTNQSNAPVTDIVVTDTIPAGFSLDASSVPLWSGGAGATGTTTTTIAGPIAAGGTAGLTITMVADNPLADGTYTNYSEVTQFEDGAGVVQADIDSDVDLGAGNDPNEIDNDISNASADHDDLDPETVDVGQTYDVALTKTNATPTSIAAGDPVTFTITVTNQSTAPVTDAVVTDTIPAGFSLDASSSPLWSGGAGAIGTTTTTIAGPIAAGATAQVTITLLADNPLAAGTFTNYAEVTQFEDASGTVQADSDSDADLGAGNDPNEINDDISNASADHDDLDPEPVTVNDVYDVALTKTNPTPASILPGGTVDYTITVTNQSTASVQDVVVTDTIPAGFSLDASSSPLWSGGAGATGTTTTTLAGPIAAGATAQVTITLIADNPLAAGNYTNYAEVTQFEDLTGTIQVDSDSNADLGAGNDPNEIDNDISNASADHDDLDPEDVAVGEVFDMALTKTNATPASIQPGETVTFTITAINQSTLSVQNVVVTDTIPTGFSLDASSSPLWTGGAGATGTTTTTIVGPIASGASEIVQITLIADNPLAAGSFTNYAEITQFENLSGGVPTDVDSNTDLGAGNDPDEIDDDTSNGSADHDDLDPDVVMVGEVYDVALTKTNATPVSIQPGDPVTFTITVTNQSTAPVTDLVVTDTIPTGFSLDASSSPLWSGGAGATGSVTTTIAGPISAGATGVLQITLLADNPLASGTFTNYAEVTQFEDAAGVVRPDSDSDTDLGAGNDPDEIDNDISNGTPDHDDLDPEDVMVGEVYDLALIKNNATPTSIAAGGDVTFTITVTNQSTAAVTDVVVTDTIPSGFSLAAASSPLWSGGAGATGTTTTTIAGPVAAGANVSVDITLTANSPLASGTFTNYAEVTQFEDAVGVVQPDNDSDTDLGAGNDPNEIDDDISNGSADHDDLDPDTVTVTETYDVALQKTAATPGVILAGQPVTFTITVTNQSSAAVTDVVVTDTIPAGFSLDASSSPLWSGGAGATGSTTTTLAGPIAAGGTAQVTITLLSASPLPGGSYVNYAEVTQFEDGAGVVQADSDSDVDLGAGNDPNEINDDIANGSLDHDDLDPEPVLVAEAYDLALQKSGATPGTIAPGETVTFTLTATNQSTAAVQNVVLTDTIPAGFSLDASSTPLWSGGVGATGLTTTTIAGPIAAGGTAQVTITLLADDPLAAGDYTNYAEITQFEDLGGMVQPDSDSDTDLGAGNDPNEIDDDISNGSADHDDLDPDTVTVSEVYDVALTKTNATPSAIAPGDPVTFTITVTNQSTAPVTDVVVTDTIPTGFSLDASSSPLWSGGAGATGTTTTTLAGPIAAAATAQVTITLLADDPLAAGTFTNYAEVTQFEDAVGVVQADADSDADLGAGNDPNEINDDISNASADHDDLDPEPVTVNEVYDVALTKANATPSTISPGDPVTFTITVTNQSTAPVTDVVVTDTMPAGFSLDASSSPLWSGGAGATGTTTTTIAGPIAASATAQVTITLLADDPLAAGTFTNYAEVTQFEDGAGVVQADADSDTDLGAGNDPNEIDDDISNASADHDDLDPDTVTVSDVYDVALTKTNATPSAIAAGDPVTFTITVTNQSSAAVTDVVVTDTIPAGFSLDASSSPLWSGGAGATGTTITTIAGPIAGGATAQVTITLLADNPLAAGTFTNYAEVTQFEDAAGVVQADADSDTDLGAGNDPNEINDDISNASADHDDLDPEPVTVSDVYDVALTKTNPTPASVLPGGTVDFTITVTNQSTASVQDVVVTDTIPAGFSLDASSSPLWSGGAGATGTTTTTLAGPIAAAATAQVTITLVADAPLAAGNYTNYAEVTQFEDLTGTIQVDSDSNVDLGAGNDPNEIDNDISNASADHDDLDPEDVTVGEVFDMALTKTNATPASIQPGDTVTFTITAINQSTIPVQNVVVTDTIPTGFSLDASSSPLWTGGAGATGTTTTTILGPIASGASEQVTITLIADNPLVAGNYMNYAEITQFENSSGGILTDVDSNTDLGAGNDPDEIDDDVSNGSADHDDLDPDVVSVGEVFDVALTKTNATPTAIQPGDPVTFTLTVTNQSTVAVTDLVVTDTIPSGFSLDASSVPLWSGGAGATGSTTTTIAGPVAAGAIAQVTITLLADNPLAAGTFTNYAEVTQFEDAAGVVQPDSDSDTDLGAGNDPDEINDDISNGSPDHDDLDPEDVMVGEVFDAALQKSNGTPTPIMGGQDTTFTLTVTNQSTAAITDVVVTDTIPAGFSLAAVSSPLWSGGAGATGTTTTTIAGPIAPGANVSVDITLTADNPLAAGSYVNYAEITQFEDGAGVIQPDNDSNTDLGAGNDPDEIDDDIGNGSPDHDDLDPGTITVSDSYDVALQKTSATPGVILAGQPVTFTITVTNQSTAPVTDVVVTDTIPAGFSLDASSSPLWSGGAGATGTTTTTLAGPIAASGTAQVTITLLSTSPLPGGSYVNYAEVTQFEDAAGVVQADSDSDVDLGAGNDPNEINDDISNGSLDHDDLDPEPVLVAEAYDLALQKTGATPGTIAPGATVTFTLTATNQSTAAVQNVVLTDTIPTGFSLDASSSPLWSGGAGATGLTTTTLAGPIAAGATAQVTITLLADDPLAPGDYTNYAEITQFEDLGGMVQPDSDSDTDLGAGNDPNEIDDDISNGSADHDDLDPDTVTVSDVYDVALTKTNATPSTIAAGDPVTFTITVTNQSTASITDVVVTDTIPAGFSLDASSSPLWSGGAGATGTTAATLAGPIAAGATAQVTITLAADDPLVAGDYTNYAEVTEFSDAGGTVQADNDSDTDLGAGNDPNEIDDDISNGSADHDDLDPDTVTVSDSYDVALIKTNATPSTIAAGDPVTFTITVTNQSTAAVTDVVVTDTIPSGFSLDASSSPLWSGGAGATGSTTTVLAGPIAAGATAQVNITLIADSPLAAGDYTNYAEVTQFEDAAGVVQADSDSDTDLGAGNDPNEIDDDISNGSPDHDDLDPDTVTVSDSYDVALTKTNATPASIQPGDPVTFTITVTNQSSASVTDVVVTDTIPAGFSLDASSSPLWSGGAGATGSTTTTIAGPIAAGATAQVDITLVADNPLAAGSYDNYAEVTQFEDAGGTVQADADSDTDLGAGNDPDEIDNDISNGTPDHDDLDPETVLVGEVYDVALTKTNPTPASILPGAAVTFTLTVTNQSTASVQDVVVTDTIPAGFSLDASSSPLWSGGAGATGSTTTTIAGPIAAGASDVVQITLVADAPLASGNYTNYAEVTQFEDLGGTIQVDSDSNADLGAGNDPNEIDNDISNGTPDHDDLDPEDVAVGEVFDMALTKTNATPASIQPGDPVTFTLTATNQSTVIVQNVVITDTIPAGFSLDASSSPLWSGGAGATGTTTTTILGPIAAGANEVVQITLIADNPLPAGNYTNYAEITQFENLGGNVRPDVDSDTDLGAGNDPDEIDNDISNGTLDHDDLDPEVVSVGEVFDVALTKTSPTPSQIQPGDPVTFTLTVTNQSTAPVQDVVITDTIPAGFSLDASSSPLWSGGAGAVGSSTTTLVGPIAPNNSAQVMITLLADNPLAPGTYTNYAEVTQFEDTSGAVQADNDSDLDLGAGNDPDEIDNDIANGTPDHDDLDPEDVTVGDVFDMALTKTNATPSSIVPGQPVTFTLTVTNQSTDSVTDVVITDTIPVGFSLDASSVPLWSGGAGATGSTTTTLAGPIAAGANTTVTITLLADNPLAAGNYVNYAEITEFRDAGGTVQADNDSDTDLGAGNDPNEIDDDISNGSADHDDLDPDSVTVGEVFDVALQKNGATPNPILAGQPVTFTLTATNQSTAPVTGLVITDTIPAGFSLDASSVPLWSGGAGAVGTTTTTIAGPIAPGGSAVLTITLLSGSPLLGGSYVNYAEITEFRDGGGTVRADSDSDADLGAGNDPNEIDDDISNSSLDHDDLDPDVVTVIEAYDLALQKTGATPGAIAPGAAVTFMLTVTNQSTASVTDVVITDTIPAGFSLDASSVPAWTGGAGATGSSTTTVAGPIAAGMTATVPITLRADDPLAAGDYTNYAEITQFEDAGGMVQPDMDSDADVGAGNDPNEVDDDISNSPDHDDLDPDTVTVTEVYDVALIKAAPTPASIQPGDPVTYVVTVTNQSTAPVTDLVVTDTIPTGFSLDASSAGLWSGGAGATGLTTTTVAGPIAAGGMSQVSITLLADNPLAAGNYTNYAEVTQFEDAAGMVQPDVDSDADVGAGNDPNEVDDDISNSPDHDDLDPSTVSVGDVYDMALQKSAAMPASIDPGQPATFLITVFNQSTAPVQNVVVSDTIPAGFSLSALTPGGWSGGAGATGTVTTVLPGPIAAGGSTTVQIALVADDPLAAGVYENYAEITQFEDSGGMVQPDNDSDADVGAGNDPNEVDDDTTNGTDHDDLDPGPVTVNDVYDVALTKTGATPANIGPGDPVTFTITVFNQSSQPVTDVVVIDTIPAGFSLDASSAGLWSGGAGATGSTMTTLTGPIAAGAQTQVAITLLADSPLAPGDYTNYAEVTQFEDAGGMVQPDNDSDADLGAGNDPNEIDDDTDNVTPDHDDLDPDTVTVGGVYDVALTKTNPMPATIAPGDDVTFTITVINQGTEPVSNITVTDSIPTGFTLSAANSIAWVGPVNGPVTTTIGGPLAVGASVQIPITITANGVLTAGTFVNYAEVTEITDGGGNPVMDSDSDMDVGPGGDPNEVDDDTTNGTDHDDLDPSTVTVTPPGALSLGNRVWLDNGAGAGGLNNGLQDGSEPGIAGVLVNLIDSTGMIIGTAITDASGYYLFDGLMPGDYTVHLDPTNFGAGGPLANLVSSTPTEADPDGNGDVNDNGIDDLDPLSNGIFSAPVTLANGTEPVGEPGPGSGTANDDDSNLTVDFGLFEPLSIGNLVWFDDDNSGVQDAGENGISGVVLNLLDAAGNPIRDSNGNPRSVVTDGNGNYLFDGLVPGTFIVEIDVSNFLPGGPLVNFASSSGPFEENDPNLNGDQNDNGVDVSSPGTTGLRSNPVTLDYGIEPSGEPGVPGNALDPDSNLTVDFGFFNASGLYAIPTLGEWGMLFMILMLAGVATRRLRI